MSVRLPRVLSLLINSNENLCKSAENNLIRTDPNSNFQRRTVKLEDSEVGRGLSGTGTTEDRTPVTIGGLEVRGKTLNRKGAKKTEGTRIEALQG